jgi:hypothetical protein
MTIMRKRSLLPLAVVLAALLGAGRAWSSEVEQQALEQARADLARLAREYRASLERLLVLQDEAVARTADTAQRRRALLESRVVSRREVEESERAADGARAAAERTREAIAEADTAIAEAEAIRETAALPPPEPGEVRVLPTLVRHVGAGRWSLSMVPGLQSLFFERFARPLPVSALGQTSLHDRLGFDHRNALDVAVHPDSPEGQAVMAWLRENGISFIAFRGIVPGQSTGAHIHVGEPSPRLVTLPR